MSGSLISDWVHQYIARPKAHQGPIISCASMYLGFFFVLHVTSVVEHSVESCGLVSPRPARVC